jgi:hypothetical protein
VHHVQADLLVLAGLPQARPRHLYKYK